MSLNTTWTAEAIPLITTSDYGYLANLIPIILIFFISWALSKKARDILFIQFPLTLAFKIFFPFLNIALVMISFAMFIMNLIGSKGDLLADIKGTPRKIRDEVMIKADIAKQAMKRHDQTEFIKAYSKKLTDLNSPGMTKYWRR